MCVYCSLGCHFLYTQIRVYTEMKQVLDHLKHPRFQFTENEEEADIIWTFSHVRDYRWARLRARTLRLFLVLVQWLKIIFFAPLINLHFTFTFMHLADAFIQSDLQLHSGYTFSLVHVQFTLRKLSEERPHVLLNQFPCETVLTTKDCLASVARRARGGQGAPWLPNTFNLQTELPQFIRHYLQRLERWASLWSLCWKKMNVRDCNSNFSQTFPD